MRHRPLKGSLPIFARFFGTISSQLGTLLAQDDDDEKNQFFEEIGAARYYMEEAHWKIQAVIEQLEKQE